MKIYVFADWLSDKKHIGTLYVESARGVQNCSFEFSDYWLAEAKQGRISFLDPDLQNYLGRQYLSDGKSILGMLSDASPDRWGRTLLQRREEKTARNENRFPRKLNDYDYLLGVYDESRMGALRFKIDPDGQFLDDDAAMTIPPMASLRKLEAASRAYEADEGLNDEWIKQLIAPGSSLGGARPKASVIDTDGSLWIAKFPSKHDDYDQGAWEMLAHELAVMCGINTPDARLEKFSDSGSTFLVKRFDRDGRRRIHYASMMCLLGLSDGDNSRSGNGYLDIIQLIRAYSIQPKEDLKELFSRVAFSIAISNTDDHFRNHAFLLSDIGWRLSPAFDINPSAYGNNLSLNINETDSRMSMELLRSTADYYSLDDAAAVSIIDNVRNIVLNNWERLANRRHISRESIERLRIAFRDKP